MQRLRGQLEATGLSDTAMMALLKGKDAALAAAGTRASALESAKVLSSVGGGAAVPPGGKRWYFFVRGWGESPKGGL